MRLKDPAAVNVLLDHALEAAQQKSRVIFFCACPTPCNCHRSLVAHLTRLIVNSNNKPCRL
jgi:hypothetical protein